MDEKEIEKLSGIEELCSKYKNVNYTEYENSLCPSCSASLPFGLATP